MSQTYGNNQSEIYSQGTTSGVNPTASTNLRQLEEQAKTALGIRSFKYTARGEYSNPHVVAPVWCAIHFSFHEDKETRLAEACGNIGVPYILGTTSSSSIADVAKANGNRKRWFHLDWPRDDKSTLSLLTREKDNGFVDGPLLLKVIQHVDYAKLAVEAGGDGIVVSKHGVRDKLTALFDSGIRTGAGLIKALCLGAKAVFIGEPVIYGLDMDGKKGADIVIRGLLADVWQNMGLSGIRSVAECYCDKIRKVVYPGEMGHAIM
ncbi:FMN-linked oxidoreductase [Aspergillus uvarum CBS 121591]|uniref:FMN-linked oxidoreductase n=1 Tax=Aspergillus uvarum CBS 121591 TaxID=1448315 RepID=A0A319BV51_9EURO|nr:FMN-linked oxidoreductase [Aspergillus uvarum CBS 121591]PYH75419.1 FMN-linked oxidoreductase [Aspergillus uvarum CBS 121591]